MVATGHTLHNPPKKGTCVMVNYGGKWNKINRKVLKEPSGGASFNADTDG